MSPCRLKAIEFVDFLFRIGALPRVVSASNHSRGRGYLLVLASAVLFGLAAALGKLLLNGGLDPLAASLYSQLIAGLIYIPTVHRASFGRRDWRILLYLGGVGSGLAPILYFVGIGRTTAANAALLQNGEPLFTIVFAALFLGERVTRSGYAMIAIIAAGAFVVATNLEFSASAFATFLSGNLLLLAAASLWGIDNTLSAVITRRTSIPAVLGLRLLLGVAFLAPVLLVLGTSFRVPSGVVFLLVGYALACIALYAILIYNAFRAIGPVRTGAVQTTSALWGVLIALYVFPAQVPSPAQLLGGGVMILALVGLYAFGEAPAARSTPETLKASPPDGPRTP